MRISSRGDEEDSDCDVGAAYAGGHHVLRGVSHGSIGGKGDCEDGEGGGGGGGGGGVFEVDLVGGLRGGLADRWRGKDGGV